MIYLIGGPPRVGKTVLGRRVANTLGATWFATDLLRETMQLLLPALGDVDWRSEASLAEHAERMRPLLQRFVGMANAIADDYVIEGLELTPIMILALQEVCPLRSVVLVCTAPDLELIREHGGAWGAWIDGLGLEALTALPGDLRDRSYELLAECDRRGLTVIDTADSFDAALGRAMAVLLGSPDEALPREA